jgi:hypothetical protein
MPTRGSTPTPGTIPYLLVFNLFRRCRYYHVCPIGSQQP